MPYQWLTPDLPTPDNRRGRCFSVPDDVQLVAAVSGALLPLTYAASWEKFGSMTPDEAAAIMSAAFEDFVSDDKEDCKGIPSIQGKRLVRLSPTTKKWQQIAADGETWEDPTGDLEVPAQTGRSEPTDEEKICMAATNAAHVLHLLYDEALELYENEIDPAAALDFWGDYAGEIIFEALGLLVSHFAPLVGYMWTTLYGIMEILTYSAWGEKLEEKLVCVLQENASISGDIVTFDFPAVQTGIFTSGYTADQDLLVLGQVWYFLAIIGADGLNLAGETTAITEPDCYSCEYWFRTWESAGMINAEFELLQGVTDQNDNIVPQGAWTGSYAAVKADVVSHETTVYKGFSVAAWVASPVYFQTVLYEGDNAAWVHPGNPDDMPYGDLWAYREGYSNGGTWADFIFEHEDVGETSFIIALRAGTPSSLNAFRMWGEGKCPFTSGDPTPF